jgi:phosphoglycerol geranylgeranyltransferase
VKQFVDVPLIVGGGIRNCEQAKTAVAAGADVIVTGNLIEETGTKREFRKLVATVHEAGIA